MENMEKLIAELNKIFDFKETTDVGDLVLIVLGEPRMLVYAMVSAIERDTTRKDEWWHVHMQMLSVPVQPVTWTLRMTQLTGREIFTMGGEERFIKAVRLDLDTPAFKPEIKKDSQKPVGKKTPLRIVF